MNDLVQRLSTGDHRVEVSIRPERTLTALRQCLDRGYVHIRFTDTRGGTELGVPVDRERSMLVADFDSGKGQITIAGELTLDFVKVRCIAAVDLESFSGRGRLEVLQEATTAS